MEGAVRSGLSAVLALRQSLEGAAARASAADAHATSPPSVTNGHMSGIAEEVVTEVTNASVNTAEEKEVRS
jgi:hypothetical protein